MPKVLSPAARRIWRKQLVPQLRSMGLLTKVDGLMLGATCEAQAIWERAVKRLHEDGEIVEEPIVDKEGKIVGYKIKEHPACKVAHKFFGIMKSGLCEFGQTPASRSKIKVEKKSDDALDKLMGRKGVQPVEQPKDSTGPSPVAFDTGKTDNIGDELTDFDA